MGLVQSCSVILRVGSSCGGAAYCLADMPPPERRMAPRPAVEEAPAATAGTLPSAPMLGPEGEGWPLPALCAVEANAAASDRTSSRLRLRRRRSRPRHELPASGTISDVGVIRSCMRTVVQVGAIERVIPGRERRRRHKKRRSRENPKVRMTMPVSAVGEMAEMSDAAGMMSAAAGMTRGVRGMSSPVAGMSSPVARMPSPGESETARSRSSHNHCQQKGCTGQLHHRLSG